MKEIKYPPFTLGWELEASGRASKKLSGVCIDYDGSVNGDAMEYRLSKALIHDSREGMRTLRQLVMDKGLQVDSSCGFHVHTGLGIRTKKIHVWAAWFVELARAVEKEAFLSVPYSRQSNRYCKSWKSSTNSIIDQEYRREKGANGLRYNWVNPVEIFRPGGIRTIEVRLMGDSKRYPYLLSWVAACRLMARAAWRLKEGNDPSRLSEETYHLKESFATVRRSFTTGLSRENVLYNVRLLLEQSELFGEKIRPLELLKETELEMKRLSKSRKGSFQAGKWVACVRPNYVDGNVRVGNFYKVLDDADSIGLVRVIGDSGEAWYVNSDCFDPAIQRAEVATVCAAL